MVNFSISKSQSLDDVKQDFSLTLKSNGLTHWSYPLVTKTSCSLNMTYFPVDAQDCFIEISTWTYTGHEVTYSVRLNVNERLCERLSRNAEHISCFIYQQGASEVFIKSVNKTFMTWIGVECLYCTGYLAKWAQHFVKSCFGYYTSHRINVMQLPISSGFRRCFCGMWKWDKFIWVAITLTILTLFLMLGSMNVISFAV